VRAGELLAEAAEEAAEIASYASRVRSKKPRTRASGGRPASARQTSSAPCTPAM
jgi:hypothetical protein